MTLDERALTRALQQTSSLDISEADLRRARSGFASGLERRAGARRRSVIVVAALVLALVVGSLWWGARGGLRTLTPATQPSVSATADTLSTSRRPEAGFPDPVPTAGFIGFPPPGATPSEPERGTLVDEYFLFQGELPFRGSVRLYADGRLIWYLFSGITVNEPVRSTGYLEQQLTAEGVGLVRAMPETPSKHPWNLEKLLPSTGWADKTIRAYVPSRYAFCAGPVNPSTSYAWPRPGAPAPRAELLALFPPAVADLLRGRPAVPPFDGEDCLAMTTAEARQLHQALLAGGFTQDPVRNRFVLEYAKPIEGSTTDVLSGRLEPVMPDGSVGCSSCG